MCPSSRTQAVNAATTSYFRPAFEVLDSDHDGKISYDDLQTFFSDKADSGEDTHDFIGTMMSAADSNCDGFVEYEEFEKVLECGRNVGEGLMEDVFRIMDKDGDGKLSHEDLKAFMAVAGLGGDSDEDVAAMIKLGGGDGKIGGGVSYEGLLKILSVGFDV